MEIPRFRITENGDILYRAHTIDEVIVWLYNEGDISIHAYWLECIVDDIEIPADELIKAWKEGERPGDLQMF